MIEALIIEYLMVWLSLMTAGADQTTGSEPLCTDCHTDIISGTYLHSISESCDLCHLTTGEEHPGGEKPGFSLSDSEPALCLMCHETATGSDLYVHTPLKNGKCTTCHNPHSSSKPLLIRDEMPEITCYHCHSDPGAGMKSVHAPVESGDCLLCHHYHSSSEQFMLQASYSAKTYSEASEENYSLCFICHDTALMLEKESSWSTGFRNGESNLHYLHTNGVKGIGCSVCHETHSSGNDFLISRNSLFGNWAMPVIFEPAPGGGSCRTGCHGPLSYSREPANDSLQQNNNY
jgi:predicted CXXCH cytochrome family protein